MKSVRINILHSSLSTLHSQKVFYQKFLLAMFTLLCAAAVNLAAAGSDQAPDWLAQDARLATPNYRIADVPAVVLRNEQSVAIDGDGTITTTTNYAVRILTNSGRDEADAHEVYATDGGKVREITAWLIRGAGGAGKKYDKKETLDIALATNDVYNEMRVKVIDASRDAQPGDVFGYQAVTEERSVFSQTDFAFQRRLPVLFSKFSANLPNGWRADSITFNRAEVKPSVNGSAYTWELRDLQPIRPEPMSPKVSSLAPRLAVSYFPPENVGSAMPLRAFKNWSDVARFMANIEDQQATIDDALAAKAKDLTKDAATEMDKIRAIGRYVQQTQYISIQTNLANGGGYKPHLATEVFAKNYGDCKDKANLMRAMLSVVKIPAYLVSIYSGDPTYVRAEWASPQQFNHCIIAIKISDATKSEAVVVHPTLGRLLIFDPTDDITPVGSLPDHEQNSFALIDHQETDKLLKMPQAAAESNNLARTGEITLTPEGALSGTIQEKAIGSTATDFRREYRGLSTSEYSKMIEGWLARGVGSAKVGKISATDKRDDATFDLEVQFDSPHYGQVMQNRLLVFKPAIVGRRDGLALTDNHRDAPVVLDAQSVTETVTFKLPTGFTVDETPDAVKLDTAFGKYSTAYEVKDDKLIFKRQFTINAALVAPEKYDAVRKFYTDIRNAEQNPVVLVKK